MLLFSLAALALLCMNPCDKKASSETKKWRHFLYKNMHVMTEEQQHHILQTYALLAEQREPSLESCAAASPAEARSASIASNLESPPSGGAHPAVEQTLQDVLEFGRLPKEFNNPATETEVAEQRLARRVRKHHLRERAQEILEKLKSNERYRQCQFIHGCLVSQRRCTP